MKNDKQYKALVLDVDGTIVKYKEGSLPTENVTKTIKKAQNILPIILATGREFPLLKPITNHLRLSGTAICLGGAQIIDIKTEKILWEETLPKHVLVELVSFFTEQHIPVYRFVGDKVTKQTVLSQKIYNIFTGPLPIEKAKEIRKKFKNHAEISCHIISYWSKNAFSVHFTSITATKQHGILYVSERLSISPQEMIGIGDGYNDFPLLMACGFKIAMGNANDDLKQIADYIAPSVEQDGVADVIEKFILPK